MATDTNASPGRGAGKKGSEALIKSTAKTIAILKSMGGKKK